MNTVFEHPGPPLGNPSWLEGFYHLESDAVFFEAVVRHPELESSVVTLLEDAISNNRDRRCVAMQDEEVPLGTSAFYALMRHDVRHVRQYGRFLRTLDLNHEVVEVACIWDVFRTHGWVPYSVELVVLRAVLPGQFGAVQMIEFVEDFGLEDALAKSPTLRSHAARVVFEELGRSSGHLRVVEARRACGIDPGRAPSLHVAFEMALHRYSRRLA